MADDKKDSKDIEEQDSAESKKHTKDESDEWEEVEDTDFDASESDDESEESDDESEKSDDESEKSDDESEKSDDESEESDNESEESDDEAEESDDEDEDDEEAAAQAALAAAQAAILAAKKKKQAKKKEKSKSEEKKNSPEEDSKKSSKKEEKSTDKSDKSNEDSSKYTTEPRVGDLIGGVFSPNKPYKEPKELDDSERFHDPMQIPLIHWVIALVVIIILGTVAVFLYAEKPEDVKDVVQGTFKAKKIAERERIEEQKRIEALKAQKKYGLLMIQGNPQYATILFDGKKRYGITSSGEWRALNLHGSVPIKNLNIKDEFEVTVKNPGFKPLTEKVTEGSWQKNPVGDDYGRMLGANLEPLSPEHKMEFDQRLAPDASTEFFGTVTINSDPPGAYVIFDEHPLKDATGKDLVTPVTFDANYVFNEKTKKYEESKIKVDTVLDVGHKIEVGIKYPNKCADNQTKCVNDDGCCPAGPKCNVATDTDCKIPVLVEALQRQNWTCTFDEEKKTSAYQAIMEGKAESASVIQQACVYSYTLNADLYGVKRFARKQEEERLKILRMNAEISGEPIESEGDEGENSDDKPSAEKATE